MPFPRFLSVRGIRKAVGESIDSQMHPVGMQMGSILFEIQWQQHNNLLRRSKCSESRCFSAIAQKRLKKRKLGLDKSTLL